MTLPVKSALPALFDRYLRAFEARDGGLPRQEYEPDWISPCQIGEPDDQGTIAWRPVGKWRPQEFEGLESALELTLHPDIRDYYGSYWSANLALTHAEGDLTLLMAWNEDDFDRLIANLIGHALQQRRAGVGLTIFFACTDTDHVLSIENATGRVVLEEPGLPPLREFGSSLGEFLADLSPSTA